MSANQSFAVAIYAMSVIAFSDPKAVSAAVIAEQIPVHPVVIRRVLGKLVAGNLINSHQGVGGGYTLACSSNTITLQDIYLCMHAENLFARENNIPSASCDECLLVEQVLLDIYQQADAALASVFSGISLADILARANPT